MAAGIRANPHPKVPARFARLQFRDTGSTSIDVSLRLLKAISLLVLALLLACSQTTPETRPSASPYQSEEIMPSASPPQRGEVTPTASRSQPKDTPPEAPREQAQGTIYYVRPDGSDFDQCTGLVHDSIDSFDAHLLPDSPAIDAGDDAIAGPMLCRRKRPYAPNRGHKSGGTDGKIVEEFERADYLGFL